LLEKIPDYSQNPNSAQTTGVDLAPVMIKPSVLLHRLEVSVYLIMSLAASIAIFPFLLTAFYWPLLWFVFLLMVAVAIKVSLRAKKSQAVSFSVVRKIWHLHTSEGDLIVKPCSEVVMWSHLIVLFVQETTSGRKHRLVALPDSIASEDWRRLRVWLRIELRKNS